MIMLVDLAGCTMPFAALSDTLGEAAKQLHGWTSALCARRYSTPCTAYDSRTLTSEARKYPALAGFDIAGVHMAFALNTTLQAKTPESRGFVHIYDAVWVAHTAREIHVPKSQSFLGYRIYNRPRRVAPPETGLSLRLVPE